MRYIIYGIAAFYGAATLALALAMSRAIEDEEPEIEDFFGKGY